MIGAAEANEVRTPRVIAREPHRLHHGLGSRHMERDLVEAGDRAQPRHIVGDHRMIAAEHRAKLAGALDRARNRALVEIIAEQVDAVGAGEVVEPVAVEVGEHHALRRLDEGRRAQVALHQLTELERHSIGVGELQVGDAVLGIRGEPHGLRVALGIQLGEPHESGMARGRDLLRRIVAAEGLRLIVSVERDEPGNPARESGMPAQGAMLRPRQGKARFQLDNRGSQGGRPGGEERKRGRDRIHRHRALTRKSYGYMTIRSAIAKVCQQEDINFLLTNRIPRRLLTRFMGWFSQIEQPLVRELSIATWRLFSDLDLSEARKRRFQSMHDCFTRELKDGARPVEHDPSILVSPCDAIVGASGEIAGTTVFQIKGFPYRLEDLMGDGDLSEAHCNGRYVTLRLTSSMYHRFHAPHDCRIEQVTYISGDTWNVNPIALKRVERLFCKNERAVLRTRLAASGHLITLVPV